MPRGATAPGRGPRLIYMFEGWEIDLDRRELRAGALSVDIGDRAFDVLEVLVQSAGEVVTKTELMARVWPGAAVEDNALQAHISAIRKALGPARDLVKTAPGRGYRLTGDWSLRDLAEDTAGLPSMPAAQRRNLPARVGRLVGREDVVNTLANKVPQHRLLTIVGPGGIGKTSVAVAAAERLVTSFRNGVCFVDLAPVENPRLVASTLCSALGLPIRSDDPVPGLIAALERQSILIVLDNCEHQIEASAMLAETLLKGAPELHVVATSREPLRADGEVTHRLGPIALPPARPSLSASEALSYAAVELFIQRANASHYPFVLADDEVHAVARICHRLDGIPLAIELAASRVGVLGVNGLADRLDDRFALMMKGRRTALPRHQTLQALLDWSFVTLTARERSLLVQLAVFKGPFTLEWARGLADPEAFTELEVAEVLSSLVAKSLVTSELTRAPAGYRLLELTRAYALAKLKGEGNLGDLLHRHAAFVLQVLQAARLDRPGKSKDEWLEANRGLIVEVRAALDWAHRDAGGTRLAVALAAASAPLWIYCELMVEGRAWLEWAASQIGSAVSEELRRDMLLFTALGALILHTGRTASLTEDLDKAWARAAALAEHLQDSECMLRCFWGRWITYYLAGDYRAAFGIATRFAEVPKDIAEPADRLVGERLLGLTLHILGDQPSARRHIEHMLDSYAPPPGRTHIARYQFDQRVVAQVCHAEILWLQGFPDQASKAIGQAIDDALSTRHVATLSYALFHGACPVTLLCGDLAAADRFIALLFQTTPSQPAASVWGQCYAAASRIQRGDLAGGTSLLRESLSQFATPAFQFRYVNFLGDLAEGELRAGNHAAAAAAAQEALEQSDHTRNLWFTAELMRLNGEILLARDGLAAATAAEQQFHRSRELARQQGALSWQLRTAISEARLLRRLGHPGEARQILESVLSQFTEGFATRDLVGAQAELTMLAANCA